MVVDKRSIVAFQNVELFGPLGSLSGIRENLWVKSTRDLAKCNAVAGLNHKFLLEPEVLLEVLKLSDKVNELVCNIAENTNTRQILLNFGRGSQVDIIKMHHFVLDEEIELPSKEAANILVDKIVESIARGIV